MGGKTPEEATQQAIGLMTGGAVLERRTNIVIEGRPLLCGVGTPNDPLSFPERYVNATIQEGQDALRAVKGCKAALITITIEIEPHCEILGGAG